MAHNHDHKHFDSLKTEKLPDGEIQITGELTLPFLVECRNEAIKHLSKTVKVDGFREGRVPESVLVQKIGEMRILEESAEIGLASEYRNIVSDLKLSPIARPNITVTKLAPGIPLEFKIVVALEPEFDLPDYKKIARETPTSLPLTKGEVDAKQTEGVSEKEKETEKFWAREKRRAAVLEALVKAAKIDLPKVLRENENKSKAELVLVKIAEVEKIEPKAEELEAEASHMLKHYPDADPLRMRLYVYQLIRNTKTLEFLENL